MDALTVQSQPAQGWPGTSSPALVADWAGDPVVGWCDAFREFPILRFAGSACVFSHSPEFLQCRCCALVQVAKGNGVPFSSVSLDVLHDGGEECRITLTGGCSFADREQLNTSGVQVDKKVSTSHALSREGCKCRVVQAPQIALQSPHPWADRLQRLYRTAWVAFLFGARCGRDLPPVQRGEGKMAYSHDSPQKNGGRPWHGWGPAATCVPRSKACALGFPSLWNLCCQQFHRAPAEHPAAEVHRWRPPLWWQTCQTLCWPLGWRHGATIRITGPEDVAGPQGGPYRALLTSSLSLIAQLVWRGLAGSDR